MPDVSETSKKSETIDLGIDLCRFRSDHELLAQQKKFVRYFLNSPGPVVDLGCGRGVMLELLRLNNIKSYGVDAFGPGVEVCRQKGLNIVEEDLFVHLKRLPASSLGGIFCSHVIEHLQPASAMILLREAVRVLLPRGTLVIVTPNSKDLMVAMEGFWLDLTHIRFYPARLLSVLLEQVGFHSIEIREDSNSRHGQVLYKRIGVFIRRLWFWGLINRGDVMAIARK